VVGGRDAGPLRLGSGESESGVTESGSLEVHCGCNEDSADSPESSLFTFGDSGESGESGPFPWAGFGRGLAGDGRFLAGLGRVFPPIGRYSQKDAQDTKEEKARRLKAEFQT